MNSQSRWHVVIVASLGLSLGIHYFRTITYPLAARRLEFHASIIDRSAPTPFRQRVLVPWLAEAAVRCIHTIAPNQISRPDQKGSQQAILASYFALDSLGLMLGLVAVYALCAEWFPPVWSLAGALLAGATLALTFGDALFHPWSQAEFAFFGWGLWLMNRRHYAWTAVVIAAATLNRETGAFLMLAALIALWPTKRADMSVQGRRGRWGSALRWGGIYILVWGTAFAGVRLAVGSPAPDFTIGKAIRGNLSFFHFVFALILNPALFGAGWICIWRGRKLSPSFVQRVSWIIPPYLAILLTFGFWNEVRYWVTLYPILIPMAISFLVAQENAAIPRKSTAAP